MNKLNPIDDLDPEEDEPYQPPSPVKDEDGLPYYTDTRLTPNENQYLKIILRKLDRVEKNQVQIQSELREYASRPYVKESK